MSSKKAAVTLTAYEDLFSSEAERQEVSREQVQNVPLELFHPFSNHPFKIMDDEKMQDTVQSISEFGVLVPVLARPRPEGGYEIVSGHRRVHASELAGRTAVPAIIRTMTDDEAILIMVSQAQDTGADLLRCVYSQDHGQASGRQRSKSHHR